MAEEKKENKEKDSSNRKSNNFSNSVKRNPWMPATIVLAIVVIVLIILVTKGGSSGGVSESTAANNLLTFVKAQTGQTAVLENTSKQGSLYLINVQFQGQSIPVYVTLDGKYMVSQPLSLTATGNSSASSSSSQATQPQNVSKSAKPSVQVFVMSWCPYGTQIEKGLLPVLSVLKDKIDFQIRWVDYTLHGPGESDENTVQYCIQKDQNAKYLPYLQCFLNNSGVYSGTPNTGSSLACQKQVGIDTNVVQTCVNQTNAAFQITTANYQAGQSYAIDAADNQKYGVQGSPTVVINGVQVNTDRSPAGLLSTICSAFTTAPAECSTNLSTAEPTPGFSFSASSAADTAAAQCGV